MSSVFVCPHCGTPHTVPPDGPPPGATCTQCRRPLTAAAITAGAPPPPTVVPVEERPPTVRRAGRRRDEEDEWDAPPTGPAPPIPGSVRAAGIIWAVFGTLILLNFALQVIAALA